MQYTSRTVDIEYSRDQHRDNDLFERRNPTYTQVLSIVYDTSTEYSVCHTVVRRLLVLCTYDYFLYSVQYYIHL